MTESNNEIQKVTIGELDAVNGGSGIFGIMGGGGPMGMLSQIMQMVQEVAAGSSPPQNSGPTPTQQFEQVLQQIGSGGQG